MPITPEPIESTVGIKPEKHELYVEANHLIAERLGVSPGIEILMKTIVEHEEDPVLLAELYCLSILNEVSA